MRSNTTASSKPAATTTSGLANHLLQRARAFEGGKARGWRSAAAVAALLFSSAALAGPEGEQVVRGNVTFERNGNQTIIRAGDRSIINYRNFDIGAAESVRFIQPGAESRVLNRINSATPTRIDGSLSANGRVYIVNPAGVVFGRGSVINTAGLFAAAGQLSDADFVRGNDRFTGLTGNVINEGSINGQQIVMAGRQVANFGSIVAPQGTVAMAAGEDVVITQRDGAMHVRVSGTALGDATTAAVTNTGTIDTSSPRGGGKVIMAAGDVFGLAINTTGTVKGKNVELQGQGTGDVVVGGQIDASNSDVRGGGLRVVRDGRNRPQALTPRERKAQEVKGGTIDVTGQRIALFNTTLDVSGADGGGLVRIGGDFQGRQIADHGNSQITVANSGTTIRADATQRGDGGTVILWSDDTTRTFASISARGGAQGGDGGLIETSGKNHLSVDGSGIDAAASNGRAGTWLLDPRNITIDGTGPTTGDFSAVDPNVFTPNQDDSVVLNSDITSRLDAGTNVSITTGATGTQDGDITVAADVLTTGTGATFRLDAANSIFVNSGVQIGATGAGQVNVVLNANRGDSADPDANAGAIVLNTGSSIVTQGGNITLGGGPNPIITLTSGGNATYDAALRSSAARGTAANPDGVTIDGATLNAGAGSISIRGAGRAEESGSVGVAILNGADISAGIVRIDGIGGTFAGSGGNANHGVDITGGTTQVRSVGGGVTIVGTGGATASGAGVTGVRVDDALVEGSSNGFLNVSGFGGSGTGLGNHGVLLTNSGALQANGINGVTITGRTTSSGDTSHGVFVESGAITSNVGTVDNAISVTGTSGTGANSVGVFVDGGDASITTASKRITLNGTSTGTGNAHGVELSNNATVNGNGVTVIGSSTNASGIAFTNGLSAIDSNIGNLTLRADTMDLAGANFGGTGTLSLESLSNNTTIGLGDSIAGTLNLNNSELGNILSTSFNGLSIGANNAGLLTTGVIDFSSFSGGAVRLFGTSLTTAGLSTGAAQTLTLRFNNPTGGQGSVTQTGPITAPRLNLFGTSQFTLRNSANDFGTLAGNLNGTSANSISDSNGFDIGQNGTTTGFVAANGRTTLRADTGVITTSAAIVANDGELALTADEIDFGDSVSGNGLLTLRAVTDAQNIRLGGASDSAVDTLDLTAADLAFFQDGFEFITIGSSAGTGTMSFGAPVSFSDATLLRMGNAGGSGAIQVNAALGTTDGASLTLRASDIDLLADVATEGGNLILNGVITARDNVALRTTANSAAAGANITINGALDADDASNDRVLTLDAGTAGDITLNSVVGSAQRFASVATTAETISINGGIRTKQGQTYDSIVNLAGELSANAGDVTFQRQVNVLADSSVTTSGLAGDDVTFQQGLNSTAAGADILVEAGNGGVSLQTTNTLGRQTYNAGTITLNADVTGAELVFGGPVILEENVIATGTASVVFEDTINSAATESRVLRINAPATTLLGEIGTGTDGILGGLFTNSGGTLALSSAIVRSTGDIEIGDNVTLGANTDIRSTGGKIDFLGSVNSDGTARSLTLNAAQTISLTGGAGGSAALQSLNITATGLSLGGLTETTTASTFSTPITLVSDTTVRAPGVTFSGPINAAGNGVQSLTVVATGNTATFAGAVGAGTNGRLRSLDVSATSINVADASTTGNQRYNGFTRLGGTLLGGDQSTIEFLQNVLLTANSTVRTSAIASDSDIRFAGTVNSAGATPFGLTVDASSGDVIFTQELGTTTAGGESSLAFLEAAGSSVTIGEGSTARNVRTTGRQFYTGSLFLNGALTSTVSGDIGISGPTTLLADGVFTTTSGSVLFQGTIDGDGSTARNLTINTGGSGVTRFGGAVGGINRLASITTNADGSTVIATTQMRANGDQLFNDNVTLAANTIMEANDVLFGGTLDSESANIQRNLTVNSSANGGDAGETTFRGIVGGARRLGSITTNAEGSTIIANNISTTRQMNFGDAVLFAGSSTLDAGNAPITFRQTINTDTSATDPLITLRSNAAGDVDNPAFRFGGNIGVTKRLGGLTIGSDRSNTLASNIVFSDAFDAQGRVQASLVNPNDAFRVITAGGGFNVGAGHKIVSFGSLQLEALSGGITFNEATVIGDFRVTADSITLRTRPQGNVQTRSRTIEGDSGADIVAAGAIDFNRAPNVIGSSFRPVFSPGNGQTDAQLAAFTFRIPPRPINASDFTDAANTGVLLPLDIRASGPSRTTITTAMNMYDPSFAAPTGGPAPLLSSAAIDGLAELGISVRGRTTSEVIEGLEGRNFDDRLPLTGLAESGVRDDIISPKSVESAVAAYRGLVYGPLVDESGAPLMDEQGNPRLGDRTEMIRSVLGASWARYSEKAKRPTGEGWRAFLETQGTTGPTDESLALALLNQARETLRAIDNIGLPAEEQRIPRRKVIDAIKPVNMTDEREFLRAVEGIWQLSVR